MQSGMKSFSYRRAAALSTALIVASLLLHSEAACVPGQTPAHCKPQGAACTLRTVSECEKPLKCVAGFCGGAPPPSPEPQSRSQCVLPVSPHEVRPSGTPAYHEEKHRDEVPYNYKNSAAVDLVVGSTDVVVYAVEDGE